MVTAEPESVSLRGRVHQGRGNATIHLEPVAPKFEGYFGAPAEPGSLNVVLAEPVLFDAGAVAISHQGHRLFWPIEIGGLDGLAYRWRGCPLHIVEIVSPLNLRDVLDLRNGDHVELRVAADMLGDLSFGSRAVWQMFWRYRENWFYFRNSYYRTITKFGMLYKHATQ